MWTEIRIPGRDCRYRWKWLDLRYKETAERHGHATGDWIIVEGWNERMGEWRPVRNLSTIGQVAKQIRVDQPPVAPRRVVVVER